MPKKKDPKRVVTGKRTRFSYLHVFEPYSMDGGPEKYGVCLIIPKDDEETIEAINAAIQAAYVEGEAKLRGNGKVTPPLDTLKTPLRDGDLEHPDDEVYANAYFLNANSSGKPNIVDRNIQPVEDRAKIYSGCYGRASITMFAYSKGGAKGIAAGLNQLQVLREGESLGGMCRAEDDFEVEEDEDDDFLA